MLTTLLSRGTSCATLLHAGKCVLIQGGFVDWKGKTKWLDFSLLCVMAGVLDPLYCTAWRRRVRSKGWVAEPFRGELLPGLWPFQFLFSGDSWLTTCFWKHCLDRAGKLWVTSSLWIEGSGNLLTSSPPDKQLNFDWSHVALMIILMWCIQKDFNLYCSPRCLSSSLSSCWIRNNITQCTCVVSSRCPRLLQPLQHQLVCERSAALKFAPLLTHTECNGFLGFILLPSRTVAQRTF